MNKGYIMPLVIGFLALLQLIAVIVILIFIDLSIGWLILMFVVFTADNFLMFYMVRERIKEIKEEEKYLK
ncbi:MAG: hypothetical protein FWC79_06095 [Oscillospiraceae bacterium]|nr:hypothetical protein [Oscillospiraceae bacterium]